MAKPYSRTKGPINSRKNRLTRRIIIYNGIIHVQASYNNTTLTVTNTKGEVVAWASAGTCGFKGREKRTPFAAESVARRLIRLVTMQEAEVRIKGSNRGRHLILRALRQSGLFISRIRNLTPHPHNGCRPVKIPKKTKKKHV